MKIAFLGDTHFGKRSDNRKFIKYVSKFYSDIFFPYLLDNDIDTIIQFGDLMDERKHVSVKGMKHATDMLFDPLKKHGMTMYTFLGNHDTVYKHSNDLNSVQYMVKGYDNIKLIQNITETDFDGLNIAFIPWVNKNNMSEFKVWLETTSAKIVCGHFEFGGFEYQKGIVSKRGMSTKGFEKFDKVYSGHYHLSSQKKNIMYLGTAYEMTFSDMNDSKGFYIFDTDTLELEKIPNPHKIYRSIIYDDTNVDYSDFDFSIYKNCYVKVYIKSKQDVGMYSRFVDGLYDADTIDINIIDMDITFEELDSNVEVQETKEIINNTVMAMKGIQKDQVLELITDLYTRSMDIES